MLRRDVLKAAGLVAASAGLATPTLAQLKNDERVVLFMTDAAFNDQTQRWTVPIHAWVHELENAAIRREVVERALRRRYDLLVTDRTKANFARRTRLLMADNERRKRLQVTIGNHPFELPLTGANGHTRTELELPASFVDQHRDGDLLPLTIALPDRAPISGAACLIEPTGWSVISDIDDTVKISEVTDKRQLLANSLLHDFIAVPGMAGFYRHLAEHRVSFHFASSSPWHFYEPLTEFLHHAGFPSASLTLKMIRLKDSSIANLWRKGTETKPAQITPILQRFKQRRFILIGDSGEQDPEVYGDLARRYGDQISAIYIRNVTAEKRSDTRWSKAFAGVSADQWQLFDHPQQLPRQLPSLAT